jgi:Fe2+ or Zn2+ uptake regulation protein
MPYIIESDYHYQLRGKMNSTADRDIVEAWTQTLREHGYRVTGPRRLVMEIIISSATALTPQEIYEASLHEDGSLGIASVYRTVDMLTELELVEHIHQPGGCHGIWPVLKGHNHHLVCSDCGQVQVVPGEEGMEQYIKKVETLTGYRVDEHWLQFFGLCTICKPAAGQDDPLKAGKENQR